MHGEEKHVAMMGEHINGKCQMPYCVMSKLFRKLAFGLQVTTFNRRWGWYWEKNVFLYGLPNRKPPVCVENYEMHL